MPDRQERRKKPEFFSDRTHQLAILIGAVNTFGAFDLWKLRLHLRLHQYGTLLDMLEQKGITISRRDSIQKLLQRKQPRSSRDIETILLQEFERRKRK